MTDPSWQGTQGSEPARRKPAPKELVLGALTAFLLESEEELARSEANELYTNELYTNEHNR